MTSNPHDQFSYGESTTGTSFDLPSPPPYNPALDLPAHQQYAPVPTQTEPVAPTPAAAPIELPLRPHPNPEQHSQPQSDPREQASASEHSSRDLPALNVEVQRQNEQPQGLAAPPPPPPRSKSPMFLSKGGSTLPAPELFAPPPRRVSDDNDDDDVAMKYMRDPHKLVAYLIPFPAPRLARKPTQPTSQPPSSLPDPLDQQQPQIEGQQAAQGLPLAALPAATPVVTPAVEVQEPPLRFLIYTPPPPPLAAPKEGEKEGKLHKVQRKWQNEVKESKSSDAKWNSWKGAKAGATKGMSWAMNNVTSHSIDFMNRVPDGKAPKDKANSGNGESSSQYGAEKKQGLDEMILIYPASLPGTQEELRENFVNTMLRTKSKAQRDAVIATGLWPAAFGIDVLLTLVWPFGGLAEVDAAWAWSSMRGAKTARSVTKRLNNDGTGGADGHGNLKLTFTPSTRLEVLRLLLADECHKRDMAMFPSAGIRPTDSTALKAIGWSPSQIGSKTRNWEEEQWELLEVKDDLQNVMTKAAKDWTGWCKAFEKNPKKALKK